MDELMAVGQVFLPRTDFGAQETCRTIVETEVLRMGYYIYGWRHVPVNVPVWVKRPMPRALKLNRSWCPIPKASMKRRLSASFMSFAAGLKKLTSCRNLWSLPGQPVVPFDYLQRHVSGGGYVGILSRFER